VDKIKSWFGYGLHVIADTKHEIPVAVNVTPASASEHTELRSMIKETFEETPGLGERCDDFAADRGLDSGKTKALYWMDTVFDRLLIFVNCGVKRSLSRDMIPRNRLRVPLYPDRVDTIVYTEMGQSSVFVLQQESKQRDMAFYGFEADRNTLKYRCPAAVNGFECKGCGECSALGNVNSQGYGRVVRINITKGDRRIFTSIPYGSPSWDRAYNRRPSLGKNQ